MIPLPPIFRAFALAAGLLFPAVAPGSVTIDAPLIDAPPMLADPGTPTYVTDPTCDGWCREIHHAYEALAVGDLHAVVEHAAAAYGIPEWAPWGIATINCETGGTWDPYANSGYYLGWQQTDPGYWPDRAAAAGFPGASPFEPVAAAGTMFSMVRAKVLAGYGQPWIDWPNCGRNAYRVIG